MAKSPELAPVKAMLLMLMGLPPVLARVAVLGPPACPTATWPQVMDVGEALADPALETPEPERATESGPEPSLTAHVAPRAPVAVGLKKTFAVQLAEAPRLDPQVVEETAKSAAFVPEIPAPLRATEAEVPLVTVIVCEALLPPMPTLPKDKLEGVAVVVPDEPLTPIPERETSCGLLLALSVKVSAAVRVPEVVGLKRIVTVQLADTASVEPHVC